MTFKRSAVLILLAGVLPACDGPVEPASSLQADVARQEALVSVQSRRLIEFAEEWPRLFEARLRTEKPHDVEEPVGDAAEVQSRDIEPPDGWPAGESKLRHDGLLRELYASDNGGFPRYFVNEAGALTPAGALILEEVERADDQALSPAKYETKQIRAGLERLQKMADVAGNAVALRIVPHELEAIERFLKDGRTLSLEEFEHGNREEVFGRLMDAVADFEHSPAPRLAAAIDTWVYRNDLIRRWGEWLEMSVADVYLKWAEDLRFGNLEKFSREEYDKYATADAPNDIHPKHFTRVIGDRLRADFGGLVSNLDKSPVRAHLQSLLPQHPQYERLKEARARYQTIVENGGWSEIRPDNMNAGGRAPLVVLLKKRLAAEGYFKADTTDDLFDNNLTQAILSYQRHHQLDQTGKVDQTFWRSLNISANQRLAEIEENIRRWHRTMFVPRDRYIYINIPSFTVELWDQGKRIDEHKVIVGNATRICNTRTREWELMNATRLMHARMTYIVFNPYWNVPPRIEVDEYQKKIAENPKWLEESDFEYAKTKDGGRVLRQKPGPNNALGKVKLIFPNRYNVYLHDTPKQGMFEYSVRAFSHGCMRVQDAMGFAKSVLTLDGQWDAKQVDKWFGERGEHAVDLNSPIDVFIEYHTVTVDDGGQPYFLADVYKIIRNQIRPPTAQERACDPAVDRVSSFRSGAAGGDTGP